MTLERKYSLLVLTFHIDPPFHLHKRFLFLILSPNCESSLIALFCPQIHLPDKNCVRGQCGAVGCRFPQCFHPIMRCESVSCVLCLQSSSPPTCPGRQQRLAQCLTPVTHVEDPDEAPGRWAWPGPTLATVTLQRGGRDWGRQWISFCGSPSVILPFK